MRSASNLTIIGVALHNYHGAHGRFPPPAIYDAGGKPLLSWRVLILPYIESDPPLFRRFKLDEPWDSPHNIKLLAEMPDLFKPIGRDAYEPYETFYQAFVGEGTCFEGAGVSVEDIKDWSSHTIMVAEGLQSVPWTKPQDLPYHVNGPLPQLGGLFKGRKSWYQDVNRIAGYNALFADGHVDFFRTEDGIDEKRLRALITRNGGEELDFNEEE
jgi:prepilin-type processing-associated H-X9-DG protein